MSSSAVGQRATQHANAIDAAKDAGVSLLACTSIAQADTSTLLLVAEHQQSEQLLPDSGVPHVLLRNGWYAENCTGQLPVYLEHGIIGAAGDGKVSPAPARTTPRPPRPCSSRTATPARPTCSASAPSR